MADEGWTKVVKPSRRKVLDANGDVTIVKEARKTDKAKKASSELLPQFDALEANAVSSRFAMPDKHKDKERKDPSPEKKEKTPLTEEQKAAARKERKKEKAKASKETDKKGPKKVSPAMQRFPIPAKVQENIMDLPNQFPGKIKDQILLVGKYLESYFGPDCPLADNLTNVSLEKVYEMPYCELKAPKLIDTLKNMFNTVDPRALPAILRELCTDAFGPGFTRGNITKGHMGTKLLIQILLRQKPEAFTSDVEAFERHFDYDGSTMSNAAATNYAWILSQLPPVAAPEAVHAWSRHLFNPLMVNDGAVGGPLVDASYAAAFTLAKEGAVTYPERASQRKAWKHTHNCDPIAVDQVLRAVRLSTKGRNRIVNLTKNLLIPFSVYFTPHSPSTYFMRLANELHTCKADTEDLILDVLVESIVLNSNKHGCLYCWTNDFMTVVRPSSKILAHMHKNISQLSSRLNGPDMEQFFKRLETKCVDMLAGELRPEGKKAKRCQYTNEDIEAVRSWLRKVNSLSKAKQVATSETAGGAGAAPVVKQKKGAKKGKGGIGFTGFVMLLVFFGLCFYLALPFLPKEVQESIHAHAAPVVQQVSQSYKEVSAKVMAQPWAKQLQGMAQDAMKSMSL